MKVAVIIYIIVGLKVQSVRSCPYRYPFGVKSGQSWYLFRHQSQPQVLSLLILQDIWQCWIARGIQGSFLIINSHGAMISRTMLARIGGGRVERFPEMLCAFSPWVTEVFMAFGHSLFRKKVGLGRSCRGNGTAFDHASPSRTCPTP